MIASCNADNTDADARHLLDFNNMVRVSVYPPPPPGYLQVALAFKDFDSNTCSIISLPNVGCCHLRTPAFRLLCKFGVHAPHPKWENDGYRALYSSPLQAGK